MRQKQRVFSLFLLSPSSRRAWIEIAIWICPMPHMFAVALLTEGVDRNCIYTGYLGGEAQVALLTEGVDRNSPGLQTYCTFRVALLTEGVDRNSPEGLAGIKDLIVALLTEGVDRNRKQLVGR